MRGRAGPVPPTRRRSESPVSPSSTSPRAAAASPGPSPAHWHTVRFTPQVRELAGRGASIDDAVRAITVADVQQACDVFTDTWKASGGVDGRVSLEVDPRLPAAPMPPAPRPRSCGKPSTGPTCWSRSRQPRRDWRPPPHQRAARGHLGDRHADLLHRAIPRCDGGFRPCRPRMNGGTVRRRGRLGGCSSHNRSHSEVHPGDAARVATRSAKATMLSS
jgi:Transaldolase/Fructose-6-phosphate aldolase